MSKGYDTNATIITTNQPQPLRPKNLLDAISEIQQFYVIESQGQDIPGQFLTIERSIDLFRIGVKSGFHEGVILILLTPFFKFYITPYIIHSDSTFVNTFFALLPYIALIINTAMCMYVSSYYVGKITRKAINSLFVGRTLSLLLKAFIIYVFYFFLYNLSTPQRVWDVAEHFKDNAEAIYYGYMKIVPIMLPVATETALLMVVGAIVPYGTEYLIDLWKRYQVKRSNRIVSSS